MEEERVQEPFLEKGPWTEQQVEILEKMREDRKHPSSIAHRLGRDEVSVRVKIRKLSKYFQTSNRTPLHEEPQALPPDLENSIFRSRLEMIWEALMTLPMTEEWEEALSNSQPGSWLSMTEEHTPSKVRSILALHQPPNIARLESTEWSQTTAAGVYGWILKPMVSQCSFDNECYLWIGSASKYGGGL